MESLSGISFLKFFIVTILLLAAFGNQIRAHNHTIASLEDCDLPPKAGLCLAYFEKYYFNSTLHRCEKFIYGGCGGNANNFETEEECKQFARLCNRKLPRQE